MNESIRILIADDHAIVRQGLRALLATEPGMKVVGEAADGVEAVALALSLRPDVILLALAMPRKDGISAIREIRANVPTARILVLTSFSDNSKVLPALTAGAQGYLLKDLSPQELLRAIRNIHRGLTALDPSVEASAFARVRGFSDETTASLTDRETGVLRLLAQGMSNQQISRRLDISENTVRNHLASVLAKLRVENRTQAALYALRHGLVGLDES